MSSKRGRKRNDNLPPNRARDVQRAFRARRAAHLQALENRVTELEDENDYLRRVLSLPPSNRPLLGKGPTGKDKPTDETRASRVSPLTSSRESSIFAESPPSRHKSFSPSSGSIPVSMCPSRPMTVIAGTTWDEAILAGDYSQQITHTAVSDTTHPVAPISNSMSVKQVPYPSYSSSITSSSRQPSIYGSHHAAYSQTSDRPSGSGYPHSYPVRSDHKQDICLSQYSFTPTGHSPHDSAVQLSSPLANDFHIPRVHANVRQLHHPQPSAGHAHSQQHQDEQRDPSLGFARRNIPSTTGFSDLGRQVYSNHSHPDLQTRSQLGHYISRAHDTPAHPARLPFTSEGHLRPMS